MEIFRQGALFSIVTETLWSVISKLRIWDTINFCKSLSFLTGMVGVTPRMTREGPITHVAVGDTPPASGADHDLRVVEAEFLELVLSSRSRSSLSRTSKSCTGVATNSTSSGDSHVNKYFGASRIWYLLITMRGRSGKSSWRRAGSRRDLPPAA